MNKRTITIDQLIREEYLKLQKEKYIKNLIQEVVTELQEQKSPFTINALKSIYTSEISSPVKVKDIEDISNSELARLVVEILEKMGMKETLGGKYNSSKSWIQDRDGQMIIYDLDGKRIKINPSHRTGLLMNTNMKMDPKWAVSPMMLSYMPTTVTQLSPTQFDPILLYNDTETLKKFIDKNPGIESLISNPINKQQLMNSLASGNNFNVQTLRTNITFIPKGPAIQYKPEPGDEDYIDFMKKQKEEGGDFDFLTTKYAPKSDDSNIIITVPNVIENTRTDVKDQAPTYFDMYIELTWIPSWDPQISNLDKFKRDRVVGAADQFEKDIQKLKDSDKKFDQALAEYSEFLKQIMDETSGTFGSKDVIQTEGLNLEEFLKYSEQFKDVSNEEFNKIYNQIKKYASNKVIDFLLALGVDIARWFTILFYYILIDPFNRVIKDVKDIDAWQTLADFAGWFPVAGDFIDLANGLVYAARGKWVDAALSLVAAIPLIGTPISKSLKVGRNVTKKIGKGAKTAKLRKILNINKKTYKLLAETPDYQRARKIIDGLGITPKQTQKLEKLYKTRLAKGDYDFIADFHYYALYNNIGMDTQLIRSLVEAQQLGNFYRLGITKLDDLKEFLDNFKNMPGFSSPTWINSYIKILSDGAKQADEMTFLQRQLLRLRSKTDDVLLNSQKMKVYGSGKVIGTVTRATAIQGLSFTFLGSGWIGLGVNILYSSIKGFDKLLAKRQFVDLASSTRKAYGQWLRKNTVTLSQEIFNKSRAWTMPKGQKQILKSYLQANKLSAKGFRSLTIVQLSEYLQWLQKNNKKAFNKLIKKVSGATTSKKYMDWTYGEIIKLGYGKRSLLLAQEAYQQQGVRGLFNSLFSVKGLDVASNEVQDLLSAIGISKSNNDEGNKTKYQGVIVAAIVKGLQMTTFDIPIAENIDAFTDTPMNQTLRKSMNDLNLGILYQGEDAEKQRNESILDKLIDARQFNQEYIAPGFDKYTDNLILKIIKGFPEERKELNNWMESNYEYVNALTKELPGFVPDQRLENGGYIIQSDIIEAPSLMYNKGSMFGGNPNQLMKNPDVKKGTDIDPFIHYGIFGEQVFKKLSEYAKKDFRNAHFKSFSGQPYITDDGTRYSIGDMYFPKEGNFYQFLKEKYPSSGGKLNLMSESDFKDMVKFGVPAGSSVYFRCQLYLAGPPTKEQIESLQNKGMVNKDQVQLFIKVKELLESKQPTQEQMDAVLNLANKIKPGTTNEQDFPGPFGKEHDYSDYGGPYGTGHHHKTKFKKGPGKNPTDSISSDRGEEEVEDDRTTGYQLVSEDPKKGTGKKPKGSGRRLYTDENPKDTVSVKFKTRQDVSDTLNKSSFKSKSHKRQSQIINLIHQRLRVAIERTKDPAKKKRLKAAYDYIKKKKEASKKKTKRLKNELKGFSPSGSGSRYRAIEKRGDKYYFRQDNPFRKGIKQEFGPYDTKEAALKKMNSYPPAVNYRDISDGVKENFADGKNPGRKGLSQRVGIPKNATIAQLEKAAKSKGEKGRLARWQLNMRRGKKKK